MMKTERSLTACVLSALFATACGATEVSGIFRDHMVVQRDKPLPVWGRGDAGEKVKVTFRGVTAETTTDAAGSWQAVLPPSALSRDPAELIVEGRDRIVFSDVLVGDVWIVSGQSNAEMKLGSASGAADEVRWCGENAPLMRTTKFAHGSSFGPETYKTGNGPWIVVDPKTARDMTALGYFFAKEIYTRTGIPIGILDNNWSGCRIEPYLAPEGLPLSPGLDCEKVVVRDKPYHYTQYYSMIQPIVRFPIAGALWYQGCANSGDGGDAYYHKLLALARGWRAKWGYEFPFYIVSLASWDKTNDNPEGGTGFGPIRDLQRRAAMDLTNSGLIVTTDIGEANDIHPKNKREVGRRAALWARRDVYGEKDLVVSGPLFKDAVPEKGALRVNFTSCGGGLVAEGGELKGFAIAGADKVWHWAKGEIDGTSVVLTAPEVAEPVAVRYAFAGNVLGRATLRNAEGLPASPFRSDDWATGSVFVKAPSFVDFDNRAKMGEELTVCFFGGSLTWSANASEPNRTGFRPLVANYLKQKYPRARFTFVDAAIGGTGSTLGIFRYERDVKAYKPDLVFLDFICNDGGENRKILATCCYESLLRRMIGDGIPVVQMFFTFRFWAQHGAPYEADNCHPRLIDYRRLVDAYATGVGDVYRDGLIDALDDGSIAPTRKEAIARVWPLDGAHPCDYGYTWFAKAGIVGFERAVKERKTCRVPKNPVFGTVEDIRRWNPAEGELPEGWARKLTFRTSAWYDGLSSRWMGDVAAFSGKESKPFAFTAEGNYIGFFGEGDDKSVKYDFVLDGTVAKTFDASPHAGGALMTWRNFPVDGWEKGESAAHSVELRPQPSADGKGWVRIGSVCTARIVPNPGLAADGAGNDDLLEKLDHARGK